MADPLRRSLLAKLRGKKSKKAAVANGTGGGERGGKFRAKVSPTAAATAATATTAAAADPQSGRAVAAVELDPTSSSRGALASSYSAPCREADPRHAPLNSITVSKKRNWLHQSSPHPPHHPDNVPALWTPEDDHANTPHIIVSNSSPDTPPPHLIDPVEENDADDEGEIWYNPIPEDEEADLPHCIPAAQPPLLLQAPPPSWAGGNTRRASAGAEEGRAGEGGGPVVEAGKANVTHSCEQNHLHRQMCRPDVQENPSTRTAATESFLCSAAGRAAADQTP